MDIFSALKILFYVGSGVASYKSYKKAKKLEKQANQLLIQKYGTGGGIPVAYGTRRVAGTVLYANTINNRELFVVYAIAVGEIDSIGNIKIGGRSVADTSVFDHYIQRNSNYFGSTQDEIDRILDNQDPPNKPRMVFNCHLGETDQVADPMLVGCIPEWTSNHRLRGIAYIAANFDYDSGGGMFTGLPEITCDIRGKKLYDPRLDSTVTNGSGSHRINDPSTYSFSDNSSLVLLDYLTNTEYGKSLPTSVIDMQSFMDSANKNTTEQTFSYSASVERLSDDDTLRFKKTTANLAVYTALKVGNPITIKIGSTTYASGTVIGKTNNSRRDAIEDEYKGDNPSYIVQDDNLYIIQLSDGAVTTPIDFNPTAVSIDITSNQDRFPFNGVIDTEESVFDNAKKILANMRGIFNYINGIYSLKIEDSESVALSIDDDDILESGIKVSVENKEEKYNIVEVEFANAQKDYELDTINYKHTSETQGEDYTYDDGGEELKLTMEMPYVTNANIAYQNAKAVLLRSRNNKNISFTGTHKLLYVKVGELISITNSQLGMSNEQYRVTRMTINHDLTININAIIYQSNIYGYVTPPTENIDIPDDMVDSFKTDAPTNLNFVDKDPTTGVQPYLTWTNPTTYPAYEFRVIVKDSNDNIKYDGRTKNNFFNLTGIEVDTGYTAEVKSLNTNYVESKATIYNFNNSVPPVQNDDLGSGSVTDEKVSDISANKITAGTIDASVITVTNLDADNITSGSIGADKITVDDLSAINSDLGDIDAGSLNIGSGAFVVTTAGAMTATSADVVGNLKTGNLVVTGDAGIHGEVRATSITAETVTVESIKQEVWNEIDRRTAPAQNGFYDDFSSTGTDGYYVGVAKNFDLLGTNDNGYQINSNDIDLRAGMVTGFATSTNYTGTALEATFQYFYKLASDSTWTALTPTYVGTTDKYTTPDGYFYELDADPSHRINSGTLTAESYYHFRLTVTPTVTNNVWTDSDAGSGYKVEYGVQQSSTGTGAGTGTVTSVSGGDGITASPSSITTTGSLAVDSTVVRTTGTQTLGGNKTFSDNVVIQGNLDVQGTTTTIDTANLDVKDKNITLNYGTGDTSANANGAGITIQDAVSATQDATLTWNTANDSFNFSHPLNVTGNISSSSTVTAASFSASSSGYGTIEVGGVSGAYIDLKRPNTDDYDLRLISFGTGGEIDTGSGDLVIKRQGSTKIATTSTGIDVTGTVTFDGGTTSADLSFADSIKAKFGAGNDLQIFHNGTKSVIQNSTGNLEINNLADDSDILFKSDNGSGGTTTYFMLDGSLGSSRALQNIRFDDNAKAIFGDGNDLQIYHDGSHSYIDEVGTGGLIIRAGGTMQLNSPTDEKMIRMVGNDAVTLYYDDSPKLATTSTGIDVTGTVTSDGLTVTSGSSADNIMQVFGGGTIYAGLGVDGTGAILTAGSSGSADSDLIIKTSSSGTEVQRARFQDNGDISFYEDTGTTAKFFWDASAESLGIGLTNPSSYWGQADNLVVGGTGNDGITIKSSTAGNGRLVFTDTASSTAGLNDGGQIHYQHSDDSLNLRTAGTTALTIDSSQNATFAGTISSGAITSTGTSTFGVATASSYKVGASTVISSSRNLLNIGTITSSVNANRFFKYRSGSIADFEVSSDNNSNAVMTVTGTGTADIFKVRDNTNDVFTVKDGGNVGIANASPSDKLDISGALRLTANISFDSNRSGRIYKASNHGLAFHGVTGTENDFAMFTPSGQLMVTNPTGTNNVSLIPTASGSVGIGTSSPSGKIDINLSTGSLSATNSGNFVLAKLEATATSSYGSATYQTVANTTNSGLFVTYLSTDNVSQLGSSRASSTQLVNTGGSSLRVGTLEATPLILGTNNAERLRIDSSGLATFFGNLTVDDKLTIGDATPNSNSFIEFGERIAATETNKPFIGQTNSGNGTSQDLGLGANSGTGTVKIFAGNVTKFSESAVRLKVASDHINFTEPLQMGGTEFLSDARNLSNIENATFSGDVSVTNELNVGQQITASGGITTDQSGQTISGFSTIRVGDALIGQDVASLTTTSASQTNRILASATTYRTLKVIVQIKSSTNFHATEILLTHNGTTVYMTEYATIFSNNSLATFDADISGGNIRLLIDPNQSASTEFKFNVSGIEA
jgi:hypothetical protein